MSDGKIWGIGAEDDEKNYSQTKKILGKSFSLRRIDKSEYESLSERNLPNCNLTIEYALKH